MDKEKDFCWPEAFPYILFWFLSRHHPEKISLVPKIFYPEHS
jgi:hypothetical protein